MPVGSRCLQNAPFEFYDPSSPIYTSPRFLPPAKIENCDIKEAIISHGAFVRDSIIDHAVVGLRSHVEKNCVIKVSLASFGGGVLICTPEAATVAGSQLLYG